MGAYTYSGTAASNTTVDGIGAAGSDSPDNIDNLVRALAASDANLLKDIGGYNTVGGSADAITVALADASTISNYTDKIIGFVAASDNATTSPTLNVDSVGAEPIKKAVAGVETALIAGDIRAGAHCLVRWRSTWDSSGGAWELLTPATIHVTGDSEASRVVSDSGTRKSSILVNSTDGSVGDGGSIIFGASGQTFAAIKAYYEDGAGNGRGSLGFSTRSASSDTSFTERLSFGMDGSWRIAATAGANGQIIKQVSGATAWGGVSTFAAAQASTSGSTIDFTSIPSWVKEICVIFDAVGLSGTDHILVQLGDSGGVETSGYVSNCGFAAAAAGTNSTAGFVIFDGDAARTITGVMLIANVTSNTWIASVAVGASTGGGCVGGGNKSTSATLDRVRVTVTGANTFDAGQIGLLYR